MTQTKLFSTGVRPIIDDYLLKKSQERRDYGKYWSASSAGYCMRKVIFDRMKIPPVKEDARKQRIFTAGHIFHSWIQQLTNAAGVSVTQEAELIDDNLRVKGHFDDLILINNKPVLYDYKTQNSRAFQWQKKNGSSMSHFHRLQLGTYMYMLRNANHTNTTEGHIFAQKYDMKDLTEARILKISKDDLCMSEEQLLWSSRLESDVTDYWYKLNTYWDSKEIPECTCADHEGGFMAKEAYNPYYYNGSPCSIDWFIKCTREKEAGDGKNKVEK